jgi:hypothetical protein
LREQSYGTAIGLFAPTTRLAREMGIADR